MADPVVAPHPNRMTDWPEIACQHGHESHATRTVHVDLAKRHGYHDWAPIPARFALRFDIDVYDWEQYRDLPPGYCPGRDAVSETIDLIGVWEPVETTVALSVCTAAVPGSLVLDFGAQLGWFSMLAASCGLDVAAIDADPVNLGVLEASAKANGWADKVGMVHDRIGPDTTLAVSTLLRSLPIALVKIDLEGAESDALRILWPLIEAGDVAHLLIEVSPVFIPGDHYPDLVCQLVDAGYRCYRLPQKRIPPHRLDRLPDDLERIDWMQRPALRAFVANCVQEDLVFSRPEAPWG